MNPAVPDESAELERLRKENAYLRFLVWKLSVRDLAEQHDKYKPWLKRTYVSDSNSRGIAS